MAEPVKKDDALAAAVREAFHRHMENARLASLTTRPTALKLEAPRPAPSPAPVRQLELKAEPVPRDALVARDAPAAPAPVPALPPQAAEPLRLPSVADSALPDLPRIDPEAIIAEAEGRLDLATAPPMEDEGLEREVRMAPPPPANDPPVRTDPARLRERPRLPQPRPKREEAPTPARPAEARRQETLHASRPAISPPVPRPGSAARREAANSNQGVHFGTGSRREVQERSSSRWIIMAALGAASLLCIGIGGYVWISASAPPPRAGAVEGQAQPAPTPAAAPATKMAAAPADPAAKTVASLPAQAPAANEESPVGAKPVRTTSIKLDTIDLAVQDARERVEAGDIASARLILERFRDGGDPRALFALAETYDPSVVHDAKLADPKQAQQLYEAAGRAGFAESAARLARLQVSPAN